MNVLYLMPQAKQAGTVAAYGFLNEEVFALARSGVVAHVLSTTAPRDTKVGDVFVHAVPRGWRARVDALRFLRACWPVLPHRNLAHALNAYYVLKVESYAAEIVRRQRIDLIHSHFAWPLGLGGALARYATGRPLVASLRGTDILLDESIAYGNREDPFYARDLKVLLSTATRTLYFSEFMRAQGIALGAAPPRTRVVRKGVDLQQFYVASDRAALKERLGVGDAPFILTVCGLIKRKGVHVIVDALGRLRDSHRFTFGICGVGPEREALEAQARALGVGDRIRFFGRIPRDRIADYFAACDVMVLASSLEAAGNVLFEAMAAARPIVCTAAGGPGEYVKDSETGFVVPVGDDEAMANRLARLLDDPQLSDRLGAAGRRRALDEFTYPRMVEDIKAIYREALGCPEVVEESRRRAGSR